jgi:hypothetical protein
MMAILFTLAPFTTKFDGSGVTFHLWRDKPSIALALRGARRPSCGRALLDSQPHARVRL